MKKCSNCGREYEHNVLFCMTCGQKFGSAEIIAQESSSTETIQHDQLIHQYTGFTLNSDSVKSLWLIAIIVGIIEIVIAYILTSGASDASNSVEMSTYMPLGLALGYILCAVYGFLVLRNAEPSNESPWAASKKVGKILAIVGIAVTFIVIFISMPEIDTEAMNQAMAQGENYDYPSLVDLGGSLGFDPIFSWLIGGFLLIYGVMKYQLRKYTEK